MHPTESKDPDAPKKEAVAGNCYESALEYNTAYLKGTEVEVENEYENIRPLQYHYVRHH